MKLLRPKIIELQSIPHPSGVITVAESTRDFPFVAQRVYFLHHLSEESNRGAHGHRNLCQLIIAAAGSFSVRLRGAHGEELFVLDRPDKALFVPPMHWRDLANFSESAVCLVLASDRYDESDYVRDEEEFDRLLLGH